MERIKFYTDQELASIFYTLEQHTINATSIYQKKIAIRNEALYKTMYYCALRVSETIQIETDSFDPVKKQIFCKRIKGGNDNTLQILDSDILSSISNHIKFNNPRKYLFENFCTSQMLSRKTCDQNLRKICDEANIPPNKWHCHVFRHTRAIHLAELSLDSKHIQFWLGHVDIKNTYIYFKYTTKQEAEMYKKMKKEMKERKNKIFNENKALSYLRESENSLSCLRELAINTDDKFAKYILSKL